MFRSVLRESSSESRAGGSALAARVSRDARELSVSQSARRGRRRSFAVACATLLSLLAAPASAGLKLKAHPTNGAAAHLQSTLRHIKGCMGNTTVAMAADGTISVGPVPMGGDNKFAAAIRTIVNGVAVELEVGRNIPKVIVGRFNKIVGGADADKTTGTQTIDLDDIEKLPNTSDCIETLWAALIHELWELHYAKTNFATDGKFMKAHNEAIKKENEVLAEQNALAHGERDDTCMRQPKTIGNPVTMGDCVTAILEFQLGHKKVGGAKAWGVYTATVVVKKSNGDVKSGPQITKVEVETGAGAALKRVVVTNPDPVVQYFDGETDTFVSEFENFPGHPQSRPGFVAAGSDGALYVTEELLNTIERRDQLTQSSLGSISHPLLVGPRGIDYYFDQQQVAVACSNNKILFFETNGTFVRELTDPALNGPTDMALDDGRFTRIGVSAEVPSAYVCNSGSNNVLILGLFGGVLGTLSSPSLSQPSGIARDPEGNTYVSSFGTNQVLVFAGNGQVIRTLSDSSLQGPQGIVLDLHEGTVARVLVAGKTSRNVVSFHADGSVTAFTAPNMVCPKGLELLNDVQSPGTRMDVTGPLVDCNSSGTVDDDEVARGLVLDIDNDAIPDECEFRYFTATLDGLQETPPNSSPATGDGCFTVDLEANTLAYLVEFTGLVGIETAAHIHGFAPPGVAAPVLQPIALGSPSSGTWSYSQSQEAGIVAGQTYVNVHTDVFPGGEIRGQIVAAPAASAYCFGDGSGTPCPCGNAGLAGNGCASSVNLSGAHLNAAGFASLACDGLVLIGSGMSNAAVLYFQGSQQEASGAGSLFGDGLLCASGSLIRLSSKINVAGISRFPASGDVPVHVRGLINAPQTAEYQCWYRNAAPWCTPATFNTTNGVHVTWVP